MTPCLRAQNTTFPFWFLAFSSNLTKKHSRCTCSPQQGKPLMMLTYQQNIYMLRRLFMLIISLFKILRSTVTVRAGQDALVSWSDSQVNINISRDIKFYIHIFKIHLLLIAWSCLSPGQVGVGSVTAFLRSSAIWKAYFDLVFLTNMPFSSHPHYLSFSLNL